MAVEETVAPPPKGRLLAGVGVFALGWIVTLGIVPLIGASSLPAATRTTISGIVVFVGPKLGVLAAIAIMGKPGFRYVKALVFGYLKPPADVSPARHRIGIVMFGAAMLLGFLEPYVLVLTDLATPGIRFSLAVDLLLLVSIFVLGGNFWDKIRALFIRESTARFPASA